MFVNPGPSKQQRIRCTSIYDVKISGCSNGPYGQINIDLAEREWRTASKAYTLIGYSLLDLEESPYPQTLTEAQYSEKILNPSMLVSAPRREQKL